MADDLINIVSITITKESAPLSQEGFGTPLILGDNASGWSDLVKDFSSLQEILDDGFLSTDEEYIAAQAIWSQNPKVPSVKIGKRGAQVAMVQTITFSGNLVTGNTINGKIGGVSIAAVPFNTSNAQTLTDLATAIQASDLVATAVSNGTNQITVTAQTAGIPSTASAFVVTGGASQATATIATTTPNHGVAEDLADIIEEDDGWYGLILTDRTQAVVEIAAAYIETIRKIFCTASDDADILDDTVTTDIVSVFQDNSYERNFAIYSATPEDFPDAAWMGRLFPYDPGSETWKFKTLAGIVPDTLTTTQIANAKAKNCNVYTVVHGQAMTAEGVMGSGEFIDITRFIDWQYADMSESVFYVLKNALKVPYTDPGIAMIENAVRASLKRGEKRGGLASDIDPDTGEVLPAFTVTVPLASQASPVDRANRVLRDVYFTARLAGAIHKVIIQGKVSV